MEISSGESIIDRKSRFQAHMTRVYSLNEVHMFADELKRNNKIAKATHNILAYRVGADSGHDSDGEDQAGRGLEVLLTSTGIDNIAVVVSRWYGGVHLGSDRFRLINKAARDLLHSKKLISESKKK